MLQISSKDDVGTDRGYIYNEKGGEAPNLAPRNSWMVAIHHSKPDHIKNKYKKDLNGAGGDGSYFTYDPTLNVQVIQ